MAWQPGQSGNPKGRTPDKVVTEQLRIVLAEETDDDGVKVKKIRRVCDALVNNAMAGEGWAIGMVFDRIEGKPSQSLDVQVGPTEVFIDFMRRMGVGGYDGKVIDGTVNSREDDTGETEWTAVLRNGHSERPALTQASGSSDRDQGKRSRRNKSGA